MLQCEGKSHSLGYFKGRDELVDGVAGEQTQPPRLPAARAGKQDGSARGGREDPLAA